MRRLRPCDKCHRIASAVEDAKIEGSLSGGDTAIDLARTLAALLPGEAEVVGLLALSASSGPR